MRDLAAKIASAAVPSHSIALSVKNISSLSAEDVSSIEEELRADLVSRGATGTDPGSTPVEVTFSQNSDGFLWVAAVGNEPETKVIILKPLARRNAVGDESRTAPVLHRSVLLRQHEPILDFAQISSGETQMLLLLEPEQIALLQNSGNNWLVNVSAPTHHSLPWPRDLRGHLVFSNGNGFEAFLPGVHCTGTLSPSLMAKCADAAGGAWAAGKLNLSFVNARNYLSISASAPDNLPAGYSVAFLNDSSAVMAGTDGIQRFWANGATTLLASARWGDDIASILPACGMNQQIVASGSGDWAQRDHLQPFEITGSTASAVGDALEFPGPIMALWSAENGNSIRVITRNLETGLYEASIVSISCGN